MVETFGDGDKARRANPLGATGAELLTDPQSFREFKRAMSISAGDQNLVAQGLVGQPVAPRYPQQNEALKPVPISPEDEKRMVDVAKALIKDGKADSGELILSLTAGQLIEQKEYKRAEKLYKELLEHQQATYGKQSSQVANTLAKLGSVCESDKRYPDAKKYYQQGLEVSQEAFKNVDNPFVPFNLASIARMDAQANDLAAAAKGFKAALEIYEKGNVFRFGDVLVLDVASSHLAYADVLKKLAEKSGDEKLKAEAKKETDRAEQILKELADRKKKLPVPGGEPIRMG